MLTPIGERLEWLRNVAELSARELDRLVGLAQNHVRSIETRIGSKAQLDTVERIAIALGVDPAWLSYGKGDRPSVDDVRAGVARARARIGIDPSATGTEG